MAMASIAHTNVEVGIETHTMEDEDAHPNSSPSMKSLCFRDEKNWAFLGVIMGICSSFHLPYLSGDVLRLTDPKMGPYRPSSPPEHQHLGEGV